MCYSEQSRGVNSWNKLFSQSTLNWKGTYFQEWPKSEGNRQKASSKVPQKLWGPGLDVVRDWIASHILNKDGMVFFILQVSQEGLMTVAFQELGQKVTLKIYQNGKTLFEE